MLSPESIAILIVEDELIVAESLALDLQRKGYTIAGIVSSGEEAIRAITVAQPDLILMDIMLKGSLDGIEASRTLRHQHPVPIVYITAFSDRATLERAKLETEPEPFYYLIKPIRLKDLIHIIQTALSAAPPKAQSRSTIASPPTQNRRTVSAPPPPPVEALEHTAVPDKWLPYVGLETAFQDPTFEEHHSSPDQP